MRVLRSPFLATLSINLKVSSGIVTLTLLRFILFSFLMELYTLRMWIGIVTTTPRRNVINFLIMGRLIIFSDLDGTLLDLRFGYSFEEALSALKAIKDRGIPLILCSSKTRAEMELIRTRMGNRDPFIVENGGAILIPEGYFDFPLDRTRKDEGYLVIELGTPYEELRQALKEIEREVGCKLRGFGDMTVEEVAERTDLSLEEARLAKQRGYDEPFLIIGDEAKGRAVLEMIGKKGLRWTKGDRFYHITGDNDKGKAVEILKGLHRKRFGEITTIGVGDSLNDLPMLNVVDIPIIVQGRNGDYAPQVELPRLVRVQGIGPGGWNSAVLNLLSQMG